MSKHFHTLKVKELIKETQNAVSIVFALSDELKESFSYKSGQYLTLKKQINGEELRRSYSISSYQGDADIQVTSKMIPNGKMSTYLFKELAVGDDLEVMPPDGNFVLDGMQDVVLFAAGSGITPILSILKDVLYNSEHQIQLFYGNRSEEEIIFKSQLEQLREEYSSRLLVQHYLSSNGERLDTDRVEAIVNGFGEGKNQSAYFICGPEGMIQSTQSAIESAGVAPSNVHVEYFGSPKTESTKETTVPASGEVNDIVVVLDDEEHEISMMPGEAILEAASRHGIDPPFSCQSGVCATCKAKLLSGEVEMENNFGLGEDEIDEGFVLTCIGKPKTAGVKISWDEY